MAMFDTKPLQAGLAALSLLSVPVPRTFAAPKHPADVRITMPQTVSQRDASLKMLSSISRKFDAWLTRERKQWDDPCFWLDYEEAVGRFKLAVAKRGILVGNAETVKLVQRNAAKLKDKDFADVTAVRGGFEHWRYYSSIEKQLRKRLPPRKKSESVTFEMLDQTDEHIEMLKILNQMPLGKTASKSSSQPSAAQQQHAPQHQVRAKAR